MRGPLWGRDVTLLYLEGAAPCSAPASRALNTLDLTYKMRSSVFWNATSRLGHTIPPQVELSCLVQEF